MFRSFVKSAFPSQQFLSLSKELLLYRAGAGLPAGLRITEDAENVINEAKVVALKFRDIKTIIILGTGGSSLGAQAIYSISRYKTKKRSSYNTPTLLFWENIDPLELATSIAQIDWDDTAVIAISKSGETPETLAQMMLLFDQFRLANNEKLIKQRFLVLTQPNESSLSKVCKEYGIEAIDHPSDVGGRFSIFSLVGILPTVLAGLDAEALCSGAIKVLKDSQQSDPLLITNIAWALEVFANNTLNIHVLMHYCDGLKLFARWFAQLWAESLGKNYIGSTPTISSGTVDQHSQLQLYLDGPNDKAFTIMGLEDSVYNRNKLNIPQISSNIEASYLSGHSLSELFVAERTATMQVLVDAKRNVRYIELSNLDEQNLGAIMAYFMLEVSVLADFLKTNAFDQPAVEHGKKLVKELMLNICQ